MSISKRGRQSALGSSSSRSTIATSSLPARGPKLKAFAREKAHHLIGKLETQMGVVIEAQADEGSVHHLRTSIRRLSECLRVFDAVIPGGDAGKLRRKLRKLMDLAAEVRNRDISGELFSKAGVEPYDPMLERLEAEKMDSRQDLLEKLSDLRKRKRAERWRGYLQ